MAQRIYVGTYTREGGEGIYRLTVDENGFSHLGGEFTENPSYLCLSPDKKTMYCACEAREGAVRAYRVQDDGSLSFLNEQPILGGACHVHASPDGKWLIAANYGLGNASVFPLNEDGSLKPIARLIVHKGAGPDLQRQKSSHVHFSSISPDSKWLAICDLGLDGVYLYPYGEDFGVADPCVKLSVPTGDGPRHLVFSKDGKYLYVLTEMGANVVVYEQTAGGYECLQVISTLPADYTGHKWGAAIRFSPDYRYVTTSNRSHDSLSVYKVQQDGKLELKQIIPSGGKTPRDFDYTPDGRLIVVAHQDEGGLALFAVDQDAGTLSDTGKRMDIPYAVGVLTCR